MSTIIEEIRRAIEASDKTRYRLSKDSGVSEAQLSRLMSGKRGLSIESVESLAEALGLEVSIGPKRSRKGA